MSSAVEQLIRDISEAIVSTDDPCEFRSKFLHAFGYPAEPVALEGLPLEAARASHRERPPWEAEIPLDTLAQSGVPVLLVQGNWCPAPSSARARAGEAFKAVCEALDERLNAERAVFPAAHNAQRLGKLFNDRLREFWEAA
ncbi:MAG: hypothetical protein ACJ74C_08895 [Gaiellaceae bacterium]